jgi:hypothetical protein
MLRLKSAALLAWHSMRPSLSVQCGQRRLDVSSSNPAMRGLLYWRPSWKSELIAKALCKRPGLFVDVGANIGQTLLDYLSSPVQNGYVGLEPSLECARHVKSVIDNNRLDNCRILPVALSDSAGVLDLHAANEADPGGTVVGRSPARSTLAD